MTALDKSRAACTDWACETIVACADRVCEAIEHETRVKKVAAFDNIVMHVLHGLAKYLRCTYRLGLRKNVGAGADRVSDQREQVTESDCVR